MAIFAAVLLLVAGRAPAEPPSHSPDAFSVDPPAPPGALFLAVASELSSLGSKSHDLMMTWVEPGQPAGRLVFARHSLSGWGPPVTVAEVVGNVDPADPSSLAVIDTQAVRRTLISRTGDLVARSGDGGRTWSRLPSGPLPFASFAGGDEGGYVFWQAAAGDGTAKLLGTRILAGETVLDPVVTWGAPTAAAMTWDGPVVVYRDQPAANGGAGGLEAISVVRRDDAQWTLPRPVHVERSRADASTPATAAENGPRVAALRRVVAVAWVSEASPGPQILVAFSDDGGETFGAPIEVDAAKGASSPAGPVDVALDDQGHAFVLWRRAQTSLVLARVAASGARGEPLVLSENLSTDPRAFPRLTPAGNQVVVAWRDREPGRLRAVQVPFAAVPALGSRKAPEERATAPAKAPTGRGRVGELAPDLELATLAGERASLTSLSGRPVLLNLWATWCLPCLAEMPELANLHERYREKGLLVVGVSVDAAEAKTSVVELVSKLEIPFAIWLDPEMRLPAALRAQSLPVTFVIDREGRILYRRDLPISAELPELGAALEHALETPL